MISACRTKGSFYRYLVIALAMILVAGCVAKGQVHRNKLGELAPGMTYEEIILALGEPESSRLLENDWILTYYFHDALYQEMLPYMLVLDKRTRRLQSWTIDRGRQQQDEETAAKISEAFGIPQQPGVSGTPAAVSAGPSSSHAGGIAGNYWGYSHGATSSSSGGSEFRVLLCPNGSFGIYSHSSYSGSEYSVSGGADWQGTWRIEGGNLMLYYSDGSQESVRYDPRERCVYFRNGATACYQSATGC